MHVDNGSLKNDRRHFMRVEVFEVDRVYYTK